MTDKSLIPTVSVSPGPVVQLPPVAGDMPGWIVGTAVSIVAGLLWLRRRTSRDTTEIAKDRAEENLIETLRNERDKAMLAAAEAWDRRTDDAQQIARLSMENEYLKRDVHRLSLEMESLKDRLDLVTSALTAMQPGFQSRL